MNKFRLVVLVTSTLATFTLFTNSYAATPSGLVIKRTSKDTWQILLQAGSNETTTFSGTFQSAQPLLAVERVRLQKADKTTLNPVDQKSLQVELTAKNNNVNIINLQMTEDAGLCVTGSGSTIYLDIANTFVPVPSPVDLTNSEACGGTPSPLTYPDDQRRFNVGHYLALVRNDSSQSTMLKSISPGLRGFLKSYSWRSLEPNEDQYNFAEVASDLSFVASHGMQLIVLIEDKTFFNQKNPIPDYLADKTVQNIRGGYTVVRWDPVVVARMEALIKAFGARFNSNEHLEGIAPLTETALSLDLNSDQLAPFAYTSEKYRDALLRVLNAGSMNLPRARVFWFMNYLTGAQYYLGDIARMTEGKGIVMGGPDVMPDDQSLERLAYPFYRGFAGKIPLFGQVESTCYRALHLDMSYPTKYWTPEELFEFGRDNLFVNYLIWVRVPQPYPLDSYDWFDAKPIVEMNPVFNQ